MTATGKADAIRAVPLAIIGGGAAGLYASITAAKLGLGCLVFERKARIGSKMLMTANGRCNFTKDIPVSRLLADIGEPVASFVRPALLACSPERILVTFKGRGLRVKYLADRRCFPASEKAADVVHVFGDLLREKEIPLVTNCPVTGLQVREGGLLVQTPHFAVRAQRVLVATGGVSFPKTGSVGDGQRFARELGLAVTPCAAGLVGVDTADPAVRARSGVVCEAANAGVEVNGRVAFRATGEIDFEATGLSGAAVYNCTRYVAREHITKWNLVLETPEGRHVVTQPRVRPVKEAIVTMGGVALSEINPQTMAAYRVPGLYFAGEVLDIDGPTGGYNLTLAFATAHLAVTQMATSIR